MNNGNNVNYDWFGKEGGRRAECLQRDQWEAARPIAVAKGKELNHRWADQGIPTSPPPSSLLPPPSSLLPPPSSLLPPPSSLLPPPSSLLPPPPPPFPPSLQRHPWSIDLRWIRHCS